MLINECSHFRRLAELIQDGTQHPLLQGSTIEPLVDGDEAYPAMLHAIENAKRSISLASYIFDNDRVGKLFLHALTQAKNRGVTIRILLDDIGARYTFPSIVRDLRKEGFQVAT